MIKFRSKTFQCLIISALVSFNTQVLALDLNHTLKAQVVTNVYEKGSVEYSSILVNDQVVYTVATKGDSNIEDKVEQMAHRLEIALNNNKDSIDKLLPCQINNSASIKFGNQNVFTFENLEGSSKPNETLLTSFQIVNAIRQALGFASLPNTIISFLNKASKDSYKTIGAINSYFNGIASWYGGKFEGRKTSSGQIFSGDKLTAAHPSLPFGTKLLVVNRKTGDSCIVEVNDRGPYAGKRVIDLSRAAAKQLNMVSNGVAMVDCLVLN